ncbi:coagulation factor XI isoform X2 [Fundulus heteroclitus]|uniref:coagulation factor XI isoform X1 n=1 Tax=Fundulus heteroclitus TaxID=8078 RepID=UPI00165B8CD7|nr:coagulation factor XI isoform X1 [Fundulus heteroclitus]XP_036003735.1 coagulation factor XI isoform X2 [Fundulus heteroclitus]
MMISMFPLRAVLLLLAFAATGNDAQLNVCGQAPLNTRSETKIVGGQDAAPGAWPWQARLIIKGGLCGGSLINNQWILTAAHCFDNNVPSDVTAYLGFQTAGGPNGVTRRGSQIIVHPDYNTRTNDNDVALVQLTSAVTFNDYVRPACLAADGSVFGDGLDCWVTGWGTTSEGGDISQTLQEVDIPIVSNSRCSETYATITDNMVCAGLTSGGKDSCQGDSGGPLVTKNGSIWIQAGVVSFGIGCAQPNIPGVYARVSRYQSWINSRITGDPPGFINFQDSTSAAGTPRLASLSLPLLLCVLPAVFSLLVLS